MNINTIQNYDLNKSNNIAFKKRLKIRIKGENFRKNPEDAKRIKAALENNPTIKKFFENHRGTITVTSGTIKVPVVLDYPDCIKKVPSRSLPFDQFKTKAASYWTKILCQYHRAFALRNIFRKRVWIYGGIKNYDEVLSWDTCIDYTLRFINENYFSKALLRCAKKRLSVEKP